MWPYCGSPYKPSCGCDDPHPGQGTVANWTRPSNTGDDALQFKDLKHKDVTKSQVSRYPSRNQDPYLVDLLLAMSRDIITTVKIQRTPYVPDGPPKVCTQLLPSYFDPISNESIPNPKYPGGQPCDYFGSVVPNCTQKEPKEYPWPFYRGLQGMVK